MRLELQENQINLLKEMLNGMKNVANEAEDDVQLSYCIQVEKKLNRINYTDFKNHQVEFLWYLADSGCELANIASKDSDSDDTKNKAEVLHIAYSEIKTSIENSIIAQSPKKA